MFSARHPDPDDRPPLPCSRGGLDSAVPHVPIRHPLLPGVPSSIGSQLECRALAIQTRAWNGATRSGLSRWPPDCCWQPFPRRSLHDRAAGPDGGGRGGAEGRARSLSRVDRPPRTCPLELALLGGAAAWAWRSSARLRDTCVAN